MRYVMTLGFRFDSIYSKVRVQRISRDEIFPPFHRLESRIQNETDLLALIDHKSDLTFITRCFISSKVLDFPNMII